MHYNGPIVRPQTDADSVFIEVTVGCTHNSCTFCNFYHGYPFKIAPMEQIEADLKEAAGVVPHARNIWASGGNPYALLTDRLIEIAHLMKKYLPYAKISTYARVDDLTRKSVDEMRRLKEAGFEDVLVGFETGDDEVLKKVNKGYTAQDILDGCKKLEEAGVSYRMIQLGGLGGKGKGKIVAHRTAKLLNQLHPYRMYLNSVQVLPDTELYEEVKRGEFVEADLREDIQEFITLLEEMKNPIELFAARNSTPFSFFIKDLQEDKEDLLLYMRTIQRRITDADERQIRRQKAMIRSV